MATTHENTVRPTFDTHSSDSAWSAGTTLALSPSSNTGDEPTEIPPLNRAVDPDVLESRLHDPVHNRDGDLSFDFHGYHATPRHHEQITLTPLGEQEARAHGN